MSTAAISALLRQPSALLAALLLAGCATSGPAGAPEPDAGGLLEAPPIKLEPGGCALVLWSATNRVRVLTSAGAPPVARIRLGGDVVDLPQSSAAGAQLSGQAERQVFANEALSLSLTLAFDDARPLPAGAMIRSGAIELRRRDGWALIVPVAGVVACEPPSGR